MTNSEDIDPNDIMDILAALEADIMGTNLYGDLGGGINPIKLPTGIFTTDKPVTTTATPFVSAADRVFNWGESVYTDLFPEHQESQDDLFGYYARLYSNGDALGEKDGNIYYYDGGAGGSGEIVLVGATSDFLPQALAAGF